MIPKTIHYCWYGGKRLSHRAEQCIKSWRKYCPDYTIIQWDESNTDFSENEVLKKAFEEGKWALVSDIVRLMAVYKYGGIYMDTDVELLKPLDAFLAHKAYFGFENKFRINTGHGFGAEAQQAIVKELLDCYKKEIFWKTDGTYQFMACPKLNSKVFFERGLEEGDSFQMLGEVAVYPSEYFCPKDYQTGRVRCTKNTYSIHHYAGSWLSFKQKLWLLFLHVIGERGRNIYDRIRKRF